MVDLTQHKKGIEAARQSHPSVCSEPRSEFLDVMTRDGYCPKSLAVGKLCRMDGPEDKRGKMSAWYVYNEIEDTYNEGNIIGVATYGCWKTGLTQSWCSRSENVMSNLERQAFHTAREAMRRQHEKETREKQSEAAELAFSIWQGSTDASTHPYLTKKGVSACEGLKIARSGHLIVPVAVNSEITSLQFIGDDGSKKFLTGGKLKGGWFVIEGEYDVVYVAEGYSTGASVHEATGKTVYIAFNAGNLYEVSSFVKEHCPDSRIILAGDDDTETKGNPGRTKATQAAEGLGFETIFPVGFVDFNDMHAALGVDALREYLNPSALKPYIQKKLECSNASRPAGVLGHIYDYYNVTSGNDQKGFATQTALACLSLILGRSFKTNFDNYTSLFFLNVGETATGKEHAKTVFEKIILNTDNGHLMAGDGYTSSGAVMSTLLDRPKHGTCTDELGRYLEASMSNSSGNMNQREANTALMECFGRCDGIMRPKNYSSMTMKKSDGDGQKNRFVHNPAVTWLSMTTPSTLFSTIDINSVKDGFINRFVISLSDAEPTVRRHKEPVAVPDTITDWARAIAERASQQHIAGEKAEPVILNFTREADDVQIAFQEELLATRKDLKKYSMDGLVGRTNECAMKIALIYALSRNPDAEFVDALDMIWGVDYMRKALGDTVSRLKMTISHSDHEADKKELLLALRSQVSDGVTWTSMLKTPPYSKHKSANLKNILQELKEAELICDEAYSSGKKGRPTVRWVAIQ